MVREAALGDAGSIRDCLHCNCRHALFNRKACGLLQKGTAHGFGLLLSMIGIGHVSAPHYLREGS
jgi:hypothetical protein